MLAIRPGAPVLISAINGIGGVGKTALALQWAHQVADRFPDGQLYVDLRGFDTRAEPLDPFTVARDFLLALGVAAKDVPASEEALTAAYRSALAQRQVLLVLDNARDVEQVRPLLPGGSANLVLITSRNHLRGLVAREGAQPVALDVLGEQAAVHLLTERIGAAQVVAEPDAVSRLIERCAGLPLALGIVAARAACGDRSRHWRTNWSRNGSTGSTSMTRRPVFVRSSRGRSGRSASRPPRCSCCSACTPARTSASPPRQASPDCRSDRFGGRSGSSSRAASSTQVRTAGSDCTTCCASSRPTAPPSCRKNSGPRRGSGCSTTTSTPPGRPAGMSRAAASAGPACRGRRSSWWWSRSRTWRPLSTGTTPNTTCCWACSGRWRRPGRTTSCGPLPTPCTCTCCADGISTKRSTSRRVGSLPRDATAASSGNRASTARWQPFISRNGTSPRRSPTWPKLCAVTRSSTT
ncbi:ATP-binding protein [Lentzea roselyniae]|uniref:ATP-binding protein n=1 Tax=Lentzea roselyniae TaxID=531940 RepID=UPI003D158589